MRKATDRVHHFAQAKTRLREAVGVAASGERIEGTDIPASDLLVSRGQCRDNCLVGEHERNSRV
jgi:hypothetical protein